MTTEDDIVQLAELGKDLPALDLDAGAAERISRRARDDLGKGRPLREIWEPVLAGLIAVAYLVWVILKLLELLR